MSDVKILLTLVMVFAMVTAVVVFVSGLGLAKHDSSVVHLDGHTCIVWRAGFSQSISCDWTKP